MPNTKNEKRTKNSKKKNPKAVTYKDSANVKADAALKLARRLNVEQERKFCDTVAAITLTNAGSILDLSVIPQNVADGGRIGDQLKFTSMELKIDMALAPSNAFSFRATIFYWHLDDTVPPISTGPPTMGDIYMVGNGPNSFFPISPYVVDGRSNFTVIADKHWTCDAGQAINRIISFSKVLKRKAQYVAGSANGLGKIYIAYMSDSPTGGTGNLYSRIRYVDA